MNIKQLITQHWADTNRNLLVTSILLITSFIWLMYQSGLLLLWIDDEQYGHGLMVLGLLIYLLYHRRQDLVVHETDYTWLGIVLSALALVISIIGDASGISVIRMYSVWIFAVAAVFAIGGRVLFKKLLVPLLIIFLLIPLPAPLGPNLTAQLQLISSKLGVLVIRLFGGVVYLEGNVIDMGGVKLLVAEACAGLRYLFPLMSLGAIAGYIMQAPLWMRWTLFLSTIPITIFMNSFRIGVTGILVENWGNSHTEGFLHFFEGWIVFIIALFLLVICALILTKILPGRRGFWDVFIVEQPLRETANLHQPEGGQRWKNKPVKFMIFCILVSSVVSSILSNRPETNIQRLPLSKFPLEIASWIGHESRLPATTEEVAGASEYYLGDFVSDDNKAVNVYISYYADQKHGQIPHSPKVCMPGDGWIIISNDPVEINNEDGSGFNANRLVIEKAGKTIVAYYWLKQGQNTYRNEMLARLDLIRFSLKSNRTDGALIRLVTELQDGEDIHRADQRLKVLADGVSERLPEYVSD